MKKIAAAIVLCMSPLGAWASCSLQTPMVSLGSYDPLNAAPPSVLVSVLATCDIPTAVAISAGKGSSNSYEKRTLSMGNQKVFYNLYVGTNKATVWGDGNFGTGVVQRMVEADTPTQFTGNASIYPSQSPSPGLYSDILIFTATF